MKIAAANVQAASAHTSVSQKTTTENLEVYRNGVLVGQYQREEIKTKSSYKGDSELFLQERDAQELSPALMKLKNESVQAVRLSAIQQIRIRTLQYLFLYLMQGRGMLRFTNVSENNDGTMTARPASAGYVYTTQKERYEMERMDFQMKGKAVTEDGRSIDFEVSVSMTREVYEAFGFTESMGMTRQVKLTDPLVVSLKGVPALTQTKYSFDLDMDGAPNQISFAGAGAGFLAWDRDGDGVIKDGSQLFGPATGNGFLELAMHDSDGNGWIDENDPIFNCLRIWCKDENGNESLFALGEVGIGAIFLGFTETDFKLMDSNVLQGEMRYSSMFLYEDGSAGTIHQIDLAN